MQNVSEFLVAHPKSRCHRETREGCFLSLFLSPAIKAQCRGAESGALHLRERWILVGRRSCHSPEHLGPDSMRAGDWSPERGELLCVMCQRAWEAEVRDGNEGEKGHVNSMKRTAGRRAEKSS